MNFFKNLFKKQEIKTISFKEKLHHFQLLLFSNDEALKLMGNLSELLATGRPFSRGQIHKIFSEIIRNTKEVTEHLSIMCDGRYKTLINQVNKIKSKTDKQLAPGSFCTKRWNCDKTDCEDCEDKDKGLKEPSFRPYSYMVDEITLEHTREVGGKMSRLCEIHNRLLIPIPDGFCLTTKCFEDFLMLGDLFTQIDKTISNIDYNDNEQVLQASQVIQALIISTPIPELIEKLILDNYEHLTAKHGDLLISVRSSAVGEDDLHFSFAGLHYTALNVSKDSLIDACFEVLISKYLPQSLVYRFLTGLRDMDMPMSIGCMQMIDSKVSGVLFTKDPVGNKEGIIIHAVWGLGTKVVDGSVAPQEFIVDRNTNKVTEYRPGNQTFKTTLRSREGLQEEKIPEELLHKSCLDENQIKIITEYALKIEKYFEMPQDIEWTIDKDGEILILQCRPLSISQPKTEFGKEQVSSETVELGHSILIDKGVCASPGAGSGKVFLLKRFKDIINFPTGGILVVKKTSPELTRVLHKAAGLISDIGNTTGHLAIIARELGIPVLVNTNNASEILTNGHVVTVDAYNNKVYEGTAKGIIDRYSDKTASENIFIKSPMYKIWQNISKLVIPLNLTNPDHSNFTPDGCKTFHDVTRFAHEFAMKEMFSLYESAQYEDKHAYPLKFSVPLDIYVIDLGNGLKDVTGKKKITPEDIISQPFLSLIKGMTSPGIRWAGPLPIDLKGFANLLMSNVIDSSRSDRDLGSRSYAIISDCYMNFFSRMGYHFSRLDAYVSDEINNNYINFNFRGGAADSIRKMRRAKVITKILEKLNFSVSLKNDHVLGTIRKIPPSLILSLLSEIGRLMGAVRNVDVTLTNDESIQQFVNAFISGDSAPALRLIEKQNIKTH